MDIKTIWQNDSVQISEQNKYSVVYSKDIWEQGHTHTTI